MAGETYGDYTLNKRAGGESGLTDGEEDISGDGVESPLADATAFTLYLGVDTATAIDVSVFLSPDGDWWYEPDESPVSVASDDASAVEHIPYNAAAVRLVGNNTTPVRAQIREVV
ncbi:hypothetical protein ABSL23_02270 [Halobacterium sp. NMX12-1]|uniref:Uncharacterized protein n=1 Tax=Halobacterium sp. NMX12-1 TaxID=3166650 RepID=A0AAU8CCK5_9EURY